MMLMPKGLRRRFPGNRARGDTPGFLKAHHQAWAATNSPPALGYELLQLLDADVIHGLEAVDTGVTGQMGLHAGVYAPHREQAAHCPQFCLHHDLASAASVQPAHGIEQKGAQLTHGE